MTTITRPDGSGVGAKANGTPRFGLISRFVRSRPGEATWVMPAQLGVLALAAVLYIVNLTVSGFANTYYSAAALAASQSWSAWFFGSIDSANFITVDKPPLATMLMGLSVRLFGLSDWSVLLPEALAGVATVAVLYAVVRRTFGPVAAVIAALVMALTPVAVLIFRYNNPDALLTLLLVMAAYAFIRALESGHIRWVAAAAVLVGLAFNTKYLQAYLVLPAFIFTYAIAAPGGWRRRTMGLAAAFVALVLSSGWWVLAIQLLPIDARPFIGGSTNNSALDVLLGYDGLGRIFGGANAGSGGGGVGRGFSGSPGLFRLFNAQFGGQIAWFIPLAIVGFGAGLLARRRAARTDVRRAAYLVWGLWLAVHAVVFSLMSGIIHSYYAVALAPAIAALVGGGLTELWRLRARFRWAGVMLGSSLLATAVVAWQLLDRTPDFAPALGIVVVAVVALVALIVALPARQNRHALQLTAAVLGVAVLLAGPAAYALNTMATAYGGGDPSAGPRVASTDDGGFAAGGGGRPPTGGFDAGGGFAGGPGGGGDSTSSALRSYLIANRGGATWIVAATSASQAGSIELATGIPVMAMGGFSGSDPAPTLTQLKAYIHSGELRFVLVGGQGGGRDGGGNASTSDASSATRDAWVTSSCTAVDYGGTGGGTLYDCAGAA
jgi:4-amino-4-deoxy-L-arabinose transferase-like glycosyltransferase